MSTRSSGQSERGIASIAHLFLSQQSDTAERRRPPETTERTSDVDETSTSEQAAGAVEPQGPAAAGGDLTEDEREFMAGAIQDDDDGEMIGHDECASFVVLSACDPDDVVEAYQTIKWLVSTYSDEPSISVLVYDAPDKETAARVFAKLADTSANFLEVLIDSAGYHLRNGSAEPVGMMGLWPVQSDGRRYVIRRGRKRPGIDEEGPASERREQSGSVSAQHEGAAGEAEANRGGGCEPSARAARGVMLRRPIAVTELPGNDLALSRTLQLTVNEWLSGWPNAMALPTAWPAGIEQSVAAVVDGQGRVHVVAASLSEGAGLWQRSLAARKWLCGNPNVLARCWPQVRINGSLPVGVVLVTAGDARALRGYGEQISEFPITVMELHLLQNETGCALLVI